MYQISLGIKQLCSNCARVQIISTALQSLFFCPILRSCLHPCCCRCFFCCRPYCYWRPCSCLYPCPCWHPCSCKCFCCCWLFCCWRYCIMKVAAWGPCCCFFSAPMAEKSVGLFESLEGDLLHSQMPEKSSGPRNATFYIPQCRKILFPSSRGQTFMAWRHVKSLAFRNAKGLLARTRRVF